MNSTRTRFMRILIAFALALPLVGCAADNAQSESDTSVDDIRIEIITPSDSGDVIAPGRHFKVSGTLEGEIPDDAILTVSLFDERGNEVRYTRANQKGTEYVTPESYDGTLTWFNEDTTFEDIAYTAPELVVGDLARPEETSRDATIKCVYTDETFYALITSATDPAHGLIGEDSYELTDEYGNAYSALPEGSYRVEATLTDVHGTPLASDTRDITIGTRNGTIIHETTSSHAISHGGMELLLAWSETENLTVLADLLPGMFGPYYQASTMPMSVGAETAEYLSGKIATLLYNNKATSTSTSLEIALYLHLEHATENPDIASYYAFDIGEPTLGDQTARIIKLSNDEPIHLCRIDEVAPETQNGVYLTNEEQIVESDTNGEDGWTAPANAPFALMGVMKPYQLQDAELVPHKEIYGYYDHLNGVETLSFTYTLTDTDESTTFVRQAGLSRVDEVGDSLNPAYYEFYCVFEAGILPAGSYNVSVEAFDRNGAPIPQLNGSFELALA